MNDLFSPKMWLGSFAVFFIKMKKIEKMAGGVEVTVASKVMRELASMGKSCKCHLLE